MYGRYKDQGLVLIGIHSDPGAAEMRAVVKELQMPWPIALDADRSFMKSLHADSYPDYYIVDRQGKIRFADLANNEVERAVKLLLEEKL